VVGRAGKRMREDRKKEGRERKEFGMVGTSQCVGQSDTNENQEHLHCQNLSSDLANYFC